MPARSGSSLRQIGVAAGIVLAVLLCAGALIAYWGVYSVAASEGHMPWVARFLEMGMRRSVAWHSRAIEPPLLEAADLVALGASHFETECAACHGRPGHPGNPAVRAMLPSPPGLGTEGRHWSRPELFWIVRHGIKYTGMPAWSGEGRDDEVWAVVAFLERLPHLDEEAYLRLAYGNASPPRRVQAAQPHRDVPSVVAGLCARCHESDAAAPASNRVPRLGGQPRTYLAAALAQYRDGKRESGIMEPVAAALDDDDIAAAAAFYSGLASAGQPGTPVSEELLAQGRAMAEDGIPARGLPPCAACHGARALDLFPRLAGQSAEYAAGQLELWRRGGRARTATGAIMAVVARRLDDDEIRAVSAYYEVRPPAGGDRP